MIEVLGVLIYHDLSIRYFIYENYYTLINYLKIFLKTKSKFNVKILDQWK